MLAMFSLFLMVMGAICITMSLSKEILFFLKPASICFILSGQSRLLQPARTLGVRVMLNAALFPLQGSWCCWLWWSSTSPCWPCLPATTRCPSPTTSPGPCPAWAVRERFLLWVGSSSCCWRCPTAPGRGASLTRTAAASRSLFCAFTTPLLLLRCRYRAATRFFYSKPEESRFMRHVLSV